MMDRWDRSFNELELTWIKFIEAPIPSILDEACAYSGLVKTDNFDSKTYLEIFEARCRISQRAGAYHFSDVDVTDSWMLVSRNNDDVIYNLLPGMGWTERQLEHTLGKETFKAAKSELRPPVKLPGKYVLLGCPGIFTYGHFLVDISIRIQLAKSMGLHGGAKFLIPAPLHPWQLSFLSIAGISTDDCVRVGETDRFQIEHLFVPVITGVNGVLNRVLADRTFRHMKVVMNNLLGAKPHTRSLIFPLHTTMSSVQHPRGLESRERVINTLRGRFGIEAFDPLRLSFAQQVDTFRNARMVVGECSSVLHNVLWSDSADLAVMAPPGHFNYYHIGIQSVNGGRTAILWGDVTDKHSGRFQLNMDSLCGMVDALLRKR